MHHSEFGQETKKVVEDRKPIFFDCKEFVVNQSINQEFMKFILWTLISHKYDLTPSEYIHVDMRFQGDKNSPAQTACHLIAVMEDVCKYC